MPTAVVKAHGRPAAADRDRLPDAGTGTVDVADGLAAGAAADRRPVGLADDRHPLDVRPHAALPRLGVRRPPGAGRARLRDGRSVRAVQRPAGGRDRLRRLGDADAAPGVAASRRRRGSSCSPCSSVPARPARPCSAASRPACSSRSRSTCAASPTEPTARAAYDTAVRAVVLDADGLPELAELPEPSGPGAARSRAGLRPLRLGRREARPRGRAGPCSGTRSPASSRTARA